MEDSHQISCIVRIYQNIYIFIFYTRVVSYYAHIYFDVKAAPSLFEIQNATPGIMHLAFEMSKKSSRTFVSRETHNSSVASESRQQRDAWALWEANASESAPARHALTTGGDTCEIERRSFGVRAEDVMGNMRPSVFVQYAKLLRRYCNNFRNKKLSAFSSLYSGCLGMRTGVREADTVDESICAIIYQF